MLVIDIADRADFAESIDSIGSRWKEEVARAKEWKPGMMRSAWTMPLERLVNEREHVIRQLGKDPGEMKVPKSMRPVCWHRRLIFPLRIFCPEITVLWPVRAAVASPLSHR